MATVSSTGLGSGLDVSSIVSQLVAIERQPIAQLQTAAKGIQTKISAYGQVNSLMSTLREASAKLAGAGLWAQSSASSDSTAVKVSGSGSAAAGSYTVSVQQLARAHSLASPAQASAEAVMGSGQLALTVGGNTTTLDFSEADTTLADIRDAINASAAGVNAAIVSDVNGARLTLTSRSSGLAQAMTIGASDLSGGAASGAFASLGYPGGMSQTQAAANALATVNGLAVESAGNQLDGAIPGLSLNLQALTSTPAEISVSSDSGGQKAAVQAFADAYNALNNYLRTQTRYDEGTSTAGTLQGDSTAVSLLGRMRSMLRESSSASASFSRFADLGFDVQKDGTVKIDSAKLDTALAQPAELAKLFGASGTAGDSSSQGLALRLRNLADSLTGFDGLLSSRSEGLRARLDRNGDEQERLENRVSQVQARLLRQYQALDASMSQLSGLSSYVTQQLNMLNSSSNKA
ncbi:flagellar filament capping protein FliD [Piscinibacter sp. Jin2]|uniref:Flagellar hook-associated protein 2 n=1 Tax=Aquariibacter lacus TaxID=2801332 RepID=A0A9X1BNS6_9BURK|nr:flagellar filament capping protein FliD [Piscinibacter lacus]MBL0720450.1 flagellar filament capping protein FliD [Piscinibacter lacus]